MMQSQVSTTQIVSQDNQTSPSDVQNKPTILIVEDDQVFDENVYTEISFGRF